MVIFANFLPPFLSNSNATTYFPDWASTVAAALTRLSPVSKILFLTKNSFIDQINQQYVMTARAKGLSERKVLYGHVFRNAMLIVIAGFPSSFIGILFSSSLFIEVIFSCVF